MKLKFFSCGDVGKLSAFFNKVGHDEVAVVFDGRHVPKETRLALDWNTLEVQLSFLKMFHEDIRFMVAPHDDKKPMGIVNGGRVLMDSKTVRDMSSEVRVNNKNGGKLYKGAEGQTYFVFHSPSVLDEAEMRI